ncbi:MAG: hypothetical protein ACREL7_13490 [Longimicrobiales bacterium]
MESERNAWVGRLRTWFGRAKTEAGDLAETAMLKVEITRLVRRREATFRAMGARVYERSRSGPALPGFEAEVAEVRDMDERIALKQAAMRKAGNTQAEPASSQASSPGAATRG